MVFYLSAVINFIILMTLVGTRDVLQREEGLQGMSHKHIPKEKKREKKKGMHGGLVSVLGARASR